MTETLRHIYNEPPPPGQVIEVAPGVLWLRMPLPMVLDHVNVYVLEDPDGWTVIDTGIDSKKTRALWGKLLGGPLASKPVARVLVTHHHPDHIGLAGWFQSELGAELITTRTAWLFARMLSLDVQEKPTEETITYWKSAGMTPEILARRLNERPFNFADSLAPMPLGFTRIKEGDRIRLGNRTWHVRTGNGHAPEHATLWSDEEDIVIGGDQLLSTISPNIGVYATEPGADPLAEWLESCERLRPFANGQQLVLPGHKFPFRGLPVRMRQLIENHHSALERLLTHLKEPKTAAECFPPLFKRKIGDGVYGLALVEAMAHVNHLFHLGKVTRNRREDGAWVWQIRE